VPQSPYHQGLTADTADHHDVDGPDWIVDQVEEHRAADGGEGETRNARNEARYKYREDDPEGALRGRQRDQPRGVGG
jgi:hypothetical protein